MDSLWREGTYSNGYVFTRWRPLLDESKWSFLLVSLIFHLVFMCELVFVAITCVHALVK